MPVSRDQLPLSHLNAVLTITLKIVVSSPPQGPVLLSGQLHLWQSTFICLPLASEKTGTERLLEELHKHPKLCPTGAGSMNGSPDTAIFVQLSLAV